MYEYARHGILKKKVCCVVCDCAVTETSIFQRTAHVHQLVVTTRQNCYRSLVRC